MKKQLLPVAALTLAGAMGCDAGHEDPVEDRPPTDEFRQYEDVDRSLESAGDSLDNLGVYPEDEREPAE